MQHFQLGTGALQLGLRAIEALVESFRRNVERRATTTGTDRLIEVEFAAFEAEGFIWGGKWSEFDLMHFEYRPELILLARLARGENLPLADIRGLVRAVR